MKPTPHPLHWLTSAVASGTLHTVSMPPSFQCPSSLTKIEDKQTLLCVRCPWKRDKQKRKKTDTPKPESFKQLNTSHRTQSDEVFGTCSITKGTVLKRTNQRQLREERLCLAPPPGRKVVKTPNPMHRQHHSHFLGIRSHTRP